MTTELTQWLCEKDTATSRTTPYNPQGSGKTEQYNGVIYETTDSSLKSKGLAIKHWETVLSDVLHSIRSVINTITNETPHQIFFNYKQKSATVNSVSTCLNESGKPLLKKTDKNSKFEPNINKVYKQIHNMRI